MNWRAIVVAAGLAFIASLFWISPLWLGGLVLLLAWRGDEEWLLDFAFWLGLWQSLFQGQGLGWYSIFYLGLVLSAYWLWGKKKNSSWRIS